MTFYEAAVEVLREAGRPLHYKKITENAIRRSLLSHVGKTPEETMHARLQQEVKKPNGLALIEQARPGVFALKAGADPADAKETLSFRQPAAEPPPAPVAAPVAAQKAPAVAPAPVEEPAAEAAEIVAEKPAKGRKKSAKTLAAEAAAEAAAAEAAAATVAETEAAEEPAAEEQTEVTTALDLEWDPSDVEPLALFGETLDDAPTAGGTVLDAPSTANAERRRKRRGRRGGRGRGREDEEGTEGSDEEGDEAPEERPATAAAQPQRNESPRGDNNRGDNNRGDNNRDGGDRDRNRQQPAANAQPAANLQPAANAQPQRPLARLAPDAAATELERILFEAVAKLQPGSSTRAEELGAVLTAAPVGTIGKLGGHGVRAIVRASAARRSALGRPPLIEELRPDGFGVAGTVTSDISRSLQSLEAWAEAHNKLVQDRLLTTLKQLSELHLAHVFSLLLNQLGYTAITTGEGADSIMGYLHARQDRSLTPRNMTVAVVSPRGQATAAEVAALREVGEAAGSNDLILFAVRGFADDATAAAAEGTPVTLIHRETFGALLLEHGVGVTRHTIALQLPDEALLRDLRA